MSKAGKKVIRAVLLNAKDRTVTDVEYDGDYKSIYSLIGCNLFTVIYLPDGDVLYIDDEGLLTMDANTVFMQTPWYPQPLAGSGLILGSTRDGNAKHAKHDAGYYREQVRFMSAQATWLAAQFGDFSNGREG